MEMAAVEEVDNANDVTDCSARFGVKVSSKVSVSIWVKSSRGSPVQADKCPKSLDHRFRFVSVSVRASDHER